MTLLSALVPRGVRGRVSLLVFCGMLPGFVLALYSATDARRRERVEIHQQAYRLARLASSAHERTLHAARELLTVMTRIPGIVDAADMRCASELRGMLAATPQFLTFGRAFGDGIVTCQARAAAPVNVAAAPWFQHALAQRAAATGGYEPSAFGPGGALIIALGFSDPKRGVVFAAVDPLALSRLAADASLPPDTSVTLVEEHGVVVARSPQHQAWAGRRAAETAIVRTALAQGEGWTEGAGLEGRPRLFGFHRLATADDVALILLIGIPREAAFAEADRRLTQQLVFLALTAAIAASAAWLASQRLVRPIRRLVGAVRQMSGGDLSARVRARPGGDELSELSAAFDSMAANLERREREAREAADALRALMQRTEAVREQERTSIAREIHDQLGQNLTALRMDVDWITRALSDAAPRPPQVDRKLASMAQLLDQTVPLVRNISRRLRPGVLDALGLRAALEWQLEEFAGRTGVETDLVCDLDDSRLHPDVSTVLFRIFQETLTNVIRHARATAVTVHLSADGEDALLEVSDNGCGISDRGAADPHALGLLGMRERAQSLGGRLQVRGVAGRGTTVSAWIPFQASEQHGTAG